jgi:hypothetical protein
VQFLHALWTENQGTVGEKAISSTRFGEGRRLMAAEIDIIQTPLAH